MSKQVVVWEWEERPNLWIPYDVEVCQFIEGQYQSGAGRHTCLNLGQVNHNLMFYDVDLKNLCQTRLGTGRVRKIKRSLYPDSYPPGQGVMWQWWNDVTFVFYDIPTCHLLEKALRAKESLLDLSGTPLNIPIVVRIGKNPMKQVNMVTKFEREVQRIFCSSYPCHVEPMVAAMLGAHGVNHVSCAGLSTHVELDTSSDAEAVSSRTSAGLPLRNNHKATTTKSTKRKKASHITKDKADSLSAFCSNVGKPPDEDCSICFEKLSNEPGFESSVESFTHKVKRLMKCDHMFHSTCLHSMYESGNKDGSLQCPTCKTIHGIKKGNQPDTGTMSLHRSHDHLPGHPDCGMIIITYDFRPGIQGSGHPQPGKRFTARGFPRVCYIPDNMKGNKVLNLLKIAWDRRLIFAVGSSSTTGEQGTVVWNEIHHKTEPYSNQSGHGYPDPNHLDNMIAELAGHGVTDEDL